MFDISETRGLIMFNLIRNKKLVGFTCFASLLAIGAFDESAASTISAVHWINSSGKNAVTELNAGRVFVTDFKGSNDLTVTESFGGVNSIYTDTFTGSPGNNPAYLSNFLGSSTNGTGNGNPGALSFLESCFCANTLQFDFSQPLTAGDRIVIADIDFNEKIQISAFSLVGADYVPVSLAGWLEQSFTGMTGTLPNSTWASWNASNGLFTAGSASNLNEPLNVLVPDQAISRVVFSKFNTPSPASTEIQFIANAGILPEPSTILLGGIGGLAWAFGRRRNAIRRNSRNS
jgi:hypothetical protein